MKKQLLTTIAICSLGATPLFAEELKDSRENRNETEITNPVKPNSKNSVTISGSVGLLNGSAKFNNQEIAKSKPVYNIGASYLICISCLIKYR